MLAPPGMAYRRPMPDPEVGLRGRGVGFRSAGRIKRAAAINAAVAWRLAAPAPSRAADAGTGYRPAVLRGRTLRARRLRRVPPREAARNPWRRDCAPGHARGVSQPQGRPFAGPPDPVGRPDTPRPASAGGRGREGSGRGKQRPETSWLRRDMPKRQGAAAASLIPLRSSPLLSQSLESLLHWVTCNRTGYLGSADARIAVPLSCRDRLDSVRDSVMAARARSRPFGEGAHRLRRIAVGQD